MLCKLKWRVSSRIASLMRFSHNINDHPASFDKNNNEFKIDCTNKKQIFNVYYIEKSVLRSVSARTYL